MATPLVDKPVMTAQRAVGLMTHRHSEGMVERHVKALKSLANSNKQGFLLSDLSELCRLFMLCSERLSVYPEYEVPVCRLVKLCRLPFLMQRASDENSFAPSVIQLMSCLGKLLEVGTPSIQIQVAESVAVFFTDPGGQLVSEDLQLTKLSYNAAIVERSGVAGKIMQIFGVTEDVNVRNSILNTLHILSSTVTNCNCMLAEDGARVVCEALANGSSSHKQVAITIELLWNLLENGSKIQGASQLSSLECMRILRSVFCDLMVNGSAGLHVRQLRNDMLVICNIIAANCPDAPFVESEFLKDLCIFATHPEVSRAGIDILKTIKLTQEHEDFELKKLFMCLLVTFSSDPSALRVLSECMALLGLFSYVIPNDKAGPDWTAAQFEELQLLALSSLCTLAPLRIEDYTVCQGNTRLLILLEWCIRHGDFGGHGNSFHGDNGRGNRMSQLRYVLRLLLSMCTSGNDIIRQDLADQGAISLFISLLTSQLSQDGDNSVLIEMKTDTVIILSSLCEHDLHRKELFCSSGGIQAILPYLRMDIKKFSCGLGHHRLLLSAVDCIWCAIVGSSLAEEILLENEGIFLLLDLLECCPDNMKNQVLGVITDLSENPKTIQHVTQWQGKKCGNPWCLIAKLWREEEEDMQVPREYMNTLAETSLPLMGVQQASEGTTPQPSCLPSPAINDVSDNLRAKLYILCNRIGFQSYPADLSTEDKISLCIAEKYLDFKEGEAWYEVAGELAQEGTRPITPDQECLQEILQITERKAEEVLKKQHELIEQQQETDLVEEQEYYAQIHEYHQTENRARTNFQQLLIRTSNYEALRAAKEEQETAIEATRTNSMVRVGERFHTTTIPSLNTTAFSGRHLTVETTPIKFTTTSNKYKQPKQPAELEVTN
ncbi:cilia- and flagella-associated protein 69-like [Dysidea avara]|uniref:cilia- and flagella-associated protein 69-like n=1 Tax=Dysidea avara TaxID=196820 RepID=UPI00332A14B7